MDLSFSTVEIPLSSSYNAFVNIPLSQRLDRKLLRTTDERVKLLAEIGIETVSDLLEFFPRDYEDASRPTHISELRADQKNFLNGKFLRVWVETPRPKMRLTKALFEEEVSGAMIECVWFQNPTIQKRLPINVPVICAAKAKLAFGKITLQNPEFERAEKEVHLGRIRPIYREHDKITASWMREKIHDLLPKTEAFSDVLPENIRESEQLLAKNEAISELHFPTDSERLQVAQKTIAFEELFLIQTAALLRKKNWENSVKGDFPTIPLDAELQKTFFASLPFVPTNAQKIAIFEILKDFEKGVPMMRLLEGDVGAGKTLVAVAALLAVVRSGGQCAFLAPTEILAQQHFAGVAKLLEPFGISVELLTGGVTGKVREVVLENTKKGGVDILVGTHALFEDAVIFRNLRFVIIDEQHRFGVAQRQRLIEKGTPHILQMTATPIPRTLAIVAYGDTDLSVLTELPPGRKPIHTKVIAPSGRRQIELFFESEMEKGRQIFVICPLVEESEKVEVASATEEFIRLEKVFPQKKIGILHGKMRPREKDKIMMQFKNREFDILVSTAVVEVGVNVPNATIMAIEGAERFGLAQLHQFRGRVGRGEHQSYCFLFPTNNPTDRLRALEKTHCGFELAEIDLEMRGFGELYGSRQSGMPDLKMANFSDGRLVLRAREAAGEFLEEYKLLENFPPILKKKLQKQENSAKT